MLKKHLGIIIVSTVAIFYRFWGLTAAGLHHDAALNSMRALGWFDFLVGVGQTTPLIWFGYIPWWANLSFHDHPPLSFLIQKIFFTIFGDSDFAALLPFALAGVLTVWLIYWVLGRLSDKRTALLGALLFAVSSFNIWSSRSGLLEALSTMFITASAAALLLFIYSPQKKFWYGWAVFVSLAGLVKYTSVFLLPAAMVFLLLFDRRMFVSRKFWGALLLMLVLLSPAVVYNGFVFQARGHFDAALSSMVGMSPADYATLSYRSLNANIGANLRGIFMTLAENISVPLFAVYLLAAAAGLARIARRDFDKVTIFLLLNIFFIILMFSFSGGGERFLPILIPFFTLLAAWQTKWLAAYFRSPHIKTAAAAVLIFVASVEALFAFNTSLRAEKNHFVELDEFLRAEALDLTLSRKRISSLTDDRMYLEFAGKEIIIFDERADWFSRVWYVDRYKYYYGAPFVYLSDLSDAVGERNIDIFSYFRAQGAAGFWLVLAEGSSVSRNIDPTYDQVTESLREDLRAKNIVPVRQIHGHGEELSFSIYHFQ